MYMGDDGRPIYADGRLPLEGLLHVGHVRILEIRKLNGAVRVPRLGVAAETALRCSGVVIPVVQVRGEWVDDASATPLLVPLLSVGRRMRSRCNGTGAIHRRRTAGRPKLRPFMMTEDRIHI